MAWLGIAFAQMVAAPSWVAGSEVRLVAPDLLSVYASGVVAGDGRLRIEGALTPGTPVRLIVFPPRASDADRAAALSGAHALLGVVAPDRSDVLLTLPDGAAVGLIAFALGQGVAVTFAWGP